MPPQVAESVATMPSCSRLTLSTYIVDTLPTLAPVLAMNWIDRKSVPAGATNEPLYVFQPADA